MPSNEVVISVKGERPHGSQPERAGDQMLAAIDARIERVRALMRMRARSVVEKIVLLDLSNNLQKQRRDLAALLAPREEK